MKTFGITAALAVACAAAQEPPTVGNVWSRVSPAEANMDAAKLDEAFEYAGGKEGLGQCLVRNECIDTTDGLDILKLTNCVQRIPLLNPNPPCGEQIDIIGATSCLASCEEGALACVLNCARDNIELGEQSFASETFCVSVHRDGKLVADKYFKKTGPVGDSDAGEVIDEFTPLVVWSVSKVFTHTVVGIAEKAGLLNTEDLASEYIEEWKDSPSEGVQVDNLMRMDSGRYYDGVTDFVLSQFQESQTDFAINMPITPVALNGLAEPQSHPPGSHYQYNQMALQNLHRVLQTATGEQDVNKYATDQLFTKLNMESRAYFMERSVVAPYLDIASKNTDPLMYGGIHVSCKDLARFGQLWLNRGRWNGTEIFTDEFYEKALTNPSANFPESGRMGRQYHWGGGSNHRASGMGGQFVSFNPEKNLVITRIGGAVGRTWSPGVFIDKVMDSLIDGPGAYSFEADEEANPVPEEEEIFANIIRGDIPQY
jgi:CubicO group peptidase (beta-lactamase class C family)